MSHATRPIEPERAVDHNRRAHDALGQDYDAGHPEIFNETEQQRLGAAVVRAVELARRTDGRAARALDVGCGTGNLTAHLIAAGASVTAADLSRTFLEVVQRRFAGTSRLDGVIQLNGRDLRPADDRTFDVVATYSVLHHVPDYIAMVREMARVTAPGGVVMIDHERTDAFWTSADHAAFMREAVTWPERRWWYWLQPSRYWKRISPLLEWRRWGNPRWMPEGDLHIWADDHIEWARIESALVAAGFEIMVREQYLAYQPRYSREVWERWRDRCSDTQLLIARKAA